MTDLDITDDHPFTKWYRRVMGWRYLAKYQLARDAYVQGWNDAMDTRPGCSGAIAHVPNAEKQQPGQLQGG